MKPMSIVALLVSLLVSSAVAQFNVEPLFLDRALTKSVFDSAHASSFVVEGYNAVPVTTGRVTYDPPEDTCVVAYDLISCVFSGGYPPCPEPCTQAMYSHMELLRNGVRWPVTTRPYPNVTGLTFWQFAVPSYAECGDKIIVMGGWDCNGTGCNFTNWFNLGSWLVCCDN